MTTHMDTVEPSGYTRDPWGAEVEEGRLYGVGAADAKAQMAAFLYAAQALRTAGIAVAGHLTLAFVVDEESGACLPYGTRYLLDHGWLDGDGVIVGDPVNTQITTAHRGLYRFRLQIHPHGHASLGAGHTRPQRHLGDGVPQTTSPLHTTPAPTERGSHMRKTLRWNTSAYRFLPCMRYNESKKPFRHRGV